MSSINSVNLTGRLGAEPELKYFESGNVKATARLAVTEFYNNQEQTHWISLECWGRNAEVLSNYCTKGSQIGVSGSLKVESWESREGGKQSRTLVRVERIALLGTKADKAKPQAEASAPAEPVNFDDCPF